MRGLIHPLDMMIVHRRETSPNPTLNAECQAGRHRVPLLTVFGLTQLGIEPRSPGARWTLYHQATAPVHRCGAHESEISTHLFTHLNHLLIHCKLLTQAGLQSIANNICEIKGLYTRKKQFCCFFNILQGIWDSMGCPIDIKIQSVILQQTLVEHQLADPPTHMPRSEQALHRDVTMGMGRFCDHKCSSPHSFECPLIIESTWFS